ncbi:MAG: hypothetical protein ACP5SE_03455, partial [Nitrososphaeria archaeon]
MLDVKWENIDLTSIIEEIQEQIVEGMTGKGYRRAGYYERELVTSPGPVTLRITKLSKDGRIASPLLDALGISRQNYSRELKMMLAEIASAASYGETSDVFKRITNAEAPKSTIHGFV